MAVIRLILLVMVLGGLTLLLVQNLSPVLPLVFLGVGTKPLPLALWILLSVVAGAFTSVSISALMKLPNLLPRQSPVSPFTKTTTQPRPQTSRREDPTSGFRSSSSSASKTDDAPNPEFDDWETNSTDDDWNFEDKPKTAPNSKNYESQKPPTSSSQSGSVYSYGYREPKNTAVGKTESVYDADYRVIVPPYKPPTTNQTDEDDWDFFEDDDLGSDDVPPTVSDRPRR